MKRKIGFAIAARVATALRAKGERRTSFAVLIAAAILGFIAAGLMFDDPGLLRPPRAANALIVKRYVATSGVDTGSCQSTAAPCRTIQYAVDHAFTSDYIYVATGIYTQTNVRSRNDITTTGSVTQVVYLTRTIDIFGGYTTTNFVTSYPLTQPTTIDAQGVGRGIYIANSAVVFLDSLNVKNGNAAGMGGGSSVNDDAGGGIYMHGGGLTMLRLNVISNTAESGGGMYMHTVTNCSSCQDSTFISNTATYGGGIYLRDSANVWLTSNIISGNIVALGVTGGGGGIYLENSPTLVQTNTISANQGGAAGGGIYVHNSAATVRGNTMSGNSAYVGGGGIYLLGSDASVMNNVIVSNTATSSLFGGGGAFIDSGSEASFISNLIRWNTSGENGGGLFIWNASSFVNNVIADNYAAHVGSGAYVGNSSKPQFNHTTIARNLGGDRIGLVADLGSNPRLTNTIAVSHTFGFSVSVGSTLTLNSALFFSNTTAISGGGTQQNLNLHGGDPKFAADGYHLTADSSHAIDQGVDAGVAFDIDGDARPIGAAPDIGADESLLRTFLPLVVK